MGAFSIGAEFTGHAIPTPDGPLSSEDYVAVETALFGGPDSKLALSLGDFSLRINGRKMPIPSVSFAAVVGSVKDPEWAAPAAPEKSKTTIGSGSRGGGGDNLPPLPPKVPIETQRAWAQRVKKVSLAEGERPLPQAGLLYFRYGGKVKGIQSIELIYSGPAGNATLELHP